MKLIKEIPADEDCGEDNGLPGPGCLAVAGAVIAFWIVVLIIAL